MDLSELENLPDTLLFQFAKQLTPDEFVRLSRTSRRQQDNCERIQSAIFRFYYHQMYDEVIPVEIIDTKRYFMNRGIWLVESYGVANGGSFYNRTYFVFNSQSYSPVDTIIKLITQTCKKNDWTLSQFVQHHEGIIIARNTSSVTSIQELQTYNRSRNHNTAWLSQQKQIYDSQFHFHFLFDDDKLFIGLEVVEFDEENFTTSPRPSIYRSITSDQIK